MIAAVATGRAGGSTSSHALVSERAFGDVRIRITRATGGALSLAGAEGTLSVHGLRRGRLAIRGQADPLQIDAGDGLLVSGESTAATVLRPSDVVTIMVPVPSGESVRPGARPTAGGAALLGGVIAFAAEAAAAAERTAPVSSEPHIELLLRDMVARLLTAEVVRDAPNPLERALAVILRRHADRTLSSRRIAEEVNFSVRQLERQFQAQGTSIAREVRHARIDAAVRLLSEDPTGTLNIEQIAQRVGFSGGSPLARAMVREGMPAPHELRPASGRSRPRGS